MTQANLIGKRRTLRRYNPDLAEKVNEETDVLAKIKSHEPAEVPDIEGIMKDTPEQLKDLQGNYTLESGIYVINHDIVVPAGVKLTIEKDVNLCFSEGCGLINNGELLIGSHQGKVILTNVVDECFWAGIHNTGKMIASNVIVMYAMGSEGGGLLNEGDATFIWSQFHYNKATYGGGILNKGGNLSFEGTMTYNTAIMHGGAIANAGGITNVRTSSISHNRAKYGGGLDNTSFESIGELIIGESTISENVGYIHGGGIHNRGGVLKLDSNRALIQLNKAKCGAGIYHESGNITIEQSNVIRGNEASVYGGGLCIVKGKVCIAEDFVIIKSNKPDDVRDNRKK